MKPGDIYRWDTDQATGHESRLKMHVFIGPGTWQTKDWVFLFINKSDFGGGYRINKSDGYTFLTYEYSFISTSAIVSYETDELKAVKPVKLGRIDPAHLKELHTAVFDSDFMDGWQIKIVCAALTPFL